jgi:hypothetical protein
MLAVFALHEKKKNGPEKGLKVKSPLFLQKRQGQSKAFFREFNYKKDSVMKGQQQLTFDSV